MHRNETRYLKAIFDRPLNVSIQRGDRGGDFSVGYFFAAARSACLALRARYFAFGVT